MLQIKLFMLIQTEHFAQMIIHFAQKKKNGANNV